MSQSATLETDTKTQERSTAMLELNKAFINGQWVETRGTQVLDMVNPASEEVFGKLTLGTTDDVDAAVAAAKAALPGYRQTTKAERLELIGRIGAAIKDRLPDLVASVVRELGAPMKLAQALQVPAGLLQVMKWSEVLQDFEFSETRGENEVVLQPIGVCALVTSWNWPINGIAGVLFPALAAGCTVVWKPSELAASTSTILLEVLDAAGVPSGVVNMVIGDGATVGNHLVTHPDISMVSFTGSAETGSRIAASIAPYTKRLVQELGGKSPYIVLDGADFDAAVQDCAIQVFRNSGQTCTTPSRLLVPQNRMQDASRIAAAVANAVKVGDPADPETDMGPIGNVAQRDKVNAFINDCVAAGQTPVAGGAGAPEGLSVGNYVRPTVFADVDNKSTLGQEEIFGPVLAIIGYDDAADAVAKANDSPYGLSAYVQGPADAAREVALQVEAGMVHVNGGGLDLTLPFGGVKRSGNGRKLGREGLLEYLEAKSLFLV